MRIFANTSITNGYQIGCFSAQLRNGNTFAQVEAVAPILGVFAFIALVASFATTVYGDDIPTMRTHYAHSLSVLVVFAVYHHIFYTGALSMNWPSVLPAFWSNYAWAAGMIYTTSMQNSISKFIGNKIGNTSEVGAAGTGTSPANFGGGYDITQIYRKRGISPVQEGLGALVKKVYTPRLPNAIEAFTNESKTAAAETHFSKRALLNHTSGFNWYGGPTMPGLPIPGNYSGFAGTLGVERIPASNAFLTGLIWFLILLLGIVFCVVAFKFALEGLIRVKAVKSQRFNYFRRHWLGYTVQAALRTCFIAFFMMTFLTLFQSSYKGATSVIVIAAIVFVLFFIGMFGIAAHACYYRLQSGKWVSEPDRLMVERKRLLRVIPWFGIRRRSKHREETEKVYAGSVPAWRLEHTPSEGDKIVHEDEAYTKKFGWLASRFRRTRWWFFAAWLVYEFVRACFLAGASGHPLTQVFGLLVVEIIAFIAIVYFKPFEGQRLNALVVYCLGFSKVVTVALSAAFDVKFNLQRIPTTAIGIVIIVIQGILTILLMIAIVLGAISTWFSIRRNVSDEEFRPRRWREYRTRYFEHLGHAATDVPAPPRKQQKKSEAVVESAPDYSKDFKVNSIQRMSKIEDEDSEFQAEIKGNTRGSFFGLDGVEEESPVEESPTEENPDAIAANPAVANGKRRSRANSVRSNMSRTSSLPYGARQHRHTWSRDDFDEVALAGIDILPPQTAAGAEPRNRSPAKGSMYSKRERSGSMPTRPRVTSRASMPGRLSSRPSYEEMSMGRSNPEYIQSLNQAYSHPDYIKNLDQAYKNEPLERIMSGVTATEDSRSEATQEAPAVPSRALSRTNSGRRVTKKRPTSVNTSAAQHRRQVSDISNGAHTPPRSPVSPVPPASPRRSMSARSFRAPASPVVPEEEGKS